MTGAPSSIYEGDPLGYPGERSPLPLLVAGGTIERIRPSEDHRAFTTTDGSDVDGVLDRLGVAGLSDRVAQLAFGANRNVANVLWKLARHDPRPPGASRSFVVLPGELADADVVACNVGYWGYVYGGLLVRGGGGADRRYLAGTRCPVSVLLLDDVQLAAIHATEGVVAAGAPVPGVSCRVADTTVELGDGVVCVAQVYSLAVPFLSFDGVTPVGLAGVDTTGRATYSAMSQAELFRSIAVRLGLEGDPIERRLLALTRARERGDVAATMSVHPLFEQLRRRVVDELALADADGVVRCGVDGALPIRADPFEPTPRYAPIG